jgi:hypothetical protein
VSSVQCKYVMRCGYIIKQVDLLGLRRCSPTWMLVRKKKRCWAFHFPRVLLHSRFPLPPFSSTRHENSLCFRSTKRTRIILRSEARRTPTLESKGLSASSSCAQLDWRGVKIQSGRDSFVGKEALDALQVDSGFN